MIASRCIATITPNRIPLRMTSTCYFKKGLSSFQARALSSWGKAPYNANPTTTHLLDSTRTDSKASDHVNSKKTGNSPTVKIRSTCCDFPQALQKTLNNWKHHKSTGCLMKWSNPRLKPNLSQKWCIRKLSISKKIPINRTFKRGNNRKNRRRNSGLMSKRAKPVSYWKNRLSCDWLTYVANWTKSDRFLYFSLFYCFN